jgi:PAS domain S-box-containing protein
MPKILLIEDNEINRDMLSRRLERKGYEVTAVGSDTEGLARAGLDNPDLILIDIYLPTPDQGDADQWDAIQQLKANSQTQAIPVIALTSDAIADEGKKLLAAGCDEYEPKPVDFSRLLEKIAKLLKPTASLPKKTNLSSDQRQLDQRQQQIVVTQLRHKLESPIYSIIGYSDMLLDGLSDQQNPALSGDLQKIYTVGMQLLQLVQAILNPILVAIQQQEINHYAFALRRELLTPLSTVMGYCEMLLEEVTPDLIPDLEQIQTSAHDLLSMVNRLDNLVSQLLRSIPANYIDKPGTAERELHRSTANLWKRQNTLESHHSLTVEVSRILVIDHSKSRSTLLSRQLERHKCQVAIASTTQQALHALNTVSYDLILLSVSLPDDRLALLEQLKVNQEWQHIPVLLIATSSEMETVTQGMTIGAVDYVIYPFQSILLHTKVLTQLVTQLEQKRFQHGNGTFNHLFEYAPIGIYRATIEGRFQRVNSALVKLLGYPDDITLIEAIMNISTQIYADCDRYAEFFCSLEKHNKVIGFEYQAYRYDGDLIWMAEHAYVVRDNSGQLLYYEGFVEEITQRKLTEAALKQQLAVQRELEHVRRAQQAAEIVQTDYFQQLQPYGELQGYPDTVRQTASHLKVLLIEDNELNCDMLSRRLQRYGYDVTIANDGADGVSKAISELPQIILMDISLPVMNGWEATQQLKANPLTSNIPIIALTAHAMAGDREKALAAGCDDYDTKPIELPRLLGKIEECLKQQN